MLHARWNENSCLSVVYGSPKAKGSLNVKGTMARGAWWSHLNKWTDVPNYATVSSELEIKRIVLFLAVVGWQTRSRAQVERLDSPDAFKIWRDGRNTATLSSGVTRWTKMGYRWLTSCHSDPQLLFSLISSQKGNTCTHVWGKIQRNWAKFSHFFEPSKQAKTKSCKERRTSLRLTSWQKHLIKEELFFLYRDTERLYPHQWNEAGTEPRLKVLNSVVRM